ncbi:MAG: hypothetical protein ACLQVF_20910 [Isosphaeraceae bacterium]
MRIKAMLLAIFSIGMPLVIAAQAGLEVTASDWLGQADCWPGGQRPSGTNLLGRLRAAHETRESVAIAEWAQNSRIPRAEQRRQRFALSMARRESAALGPNRVPIGTSCRLRCWASAQVRHAAQAQTLGNYSESLPTGCEEATQQTALAQVFQPCLPGLGRRPD